MMVRTGGARLRVLYVTLTTVIVRRGRGHGGEGDNSSVRGSPGLNVTNQTGSLGGEEVGCEKVSFV